jgi:Tol biopolymer transport system component
VLYIDRPSDQAPSGLWGVAVQGGEPQLITESLGIYSPDMQLRATLLNGTTMVERVATGEQWTIPNDGRAASFSIDGNWLAWTAGQSDPPFDTARRQVWVSRIDGSQAREVFSTVGGGFAGWFPDGRLLVSGRVEGSDTEQAYWALSLDPSQDGQPSQVELARGERLRDAQFSRDGSWLAYMVTFSQDPSQDGLWLADTHSGERLKLDVFGSYQWRDGGRLLLIPLDLSQPMHRVLQVQAATGEVQALTDPALTPFRIANGDWSVSPDGRMIAFSSAQDGNIWVLELPEQ